MLIYKQVYLPVLKKIIIFDEITNTKNKKVIAKVTTISPKGDMNVHPFIRYLSPLCRVAVGWIPSQLA